jgi:hypothetical protein
VSVDSSLSSALAELEDYLDGVPVERAAELVLPFGARWILPEVGLDLERLREEAETMARATPLSDRIVAGYADHLAYWVSQRMLVDADQAAQLARARELLRERAELTRAEGFPRVAAGLGQQPGDDELWTALALRIGEAALSSV